MAADTGCHGEDRGAFRYGFGLADIAVTGFALYISEQVRSVAPGDTGRDGINTYPGNGLLRFRKFLQA